jgi:hypothetical protein
MKNVIASAAEASARNSASLSRKKNLRTPIANAPAVASAGLRFCARPERTRGRTPPDGEPSGGVGDGEDSEESTDYFLRFFFFGLPATEACVIVSVFFCVAAVPPVGVNVTAMLTESFLPLALASFFSAAPEIGSVTVP